MMEVHNKSVKILHLLGIWLKCSNNDSGNLIGLLAKRVSYTDSIRRNK